MKRLARSVEERKARPGDFFHRLHRKRQDFVRDDLIGFFAEAFLQAAPPGNPQFGVDVDDIDSSADRLRRSSSSVPDPP